MNRSPATLLAALLCLPSVPALAQAKLPVEDFARHAEINSAALSPTGEYVALAVPNEDGMETRLHIVKLDGSGSTQVLRFGKQQHVTSLTWSDNDQIVVSRAKMEPLEARPYSYGELMSSDVAGKTQETLFAYVPDAGQQRGRRKDRGFATVVKVLDDEPGQVLVDFTAWPQRRGDEDRPTAIYKVDTRSGHRELIEQTSETATFMFDHSGRARLKTTTDDNDDPVLMYRPGAGNDWQPVPKTLAGYNMSLLYVEADNNTAYAAIVDKGEPAQLYKVDLAKGTRMRLAGREDMGIGRVLYAGHDGPPFGVIFDEGKPSVQYLDPDSEWAKLHAGLLKAFPGQMVSILDWTRDNKKLLFLVWSDRNPGGYYLLDRSNNKVQLVNEVMPWIKAGSLSPSIPISFTTSDGLTLHGLYTGAIGKGPQPLVVLPHGGPHGPYDSWGYDSDVQFLANRGYGVLQINYRGSGGRGKAFLESGYLQWGGKMQDDLADGVRWAIAQKLADPSRICTFGASYGGYAALMQPIRYPDLYKCAIGYVGVYDLQVMKKKGDIDDGASGRRYLDRALGTDIAQLKAWSPAQNAAKIKVPVLLAAGKDDLRVPMDQFNALVNAFKAAGTPAETLVFDGEGHGFYKPEHRAELYRRIEAFLAKHIGPDAR
ncbi:alpha/beta hydrolase family protein [Cognatiluteimonas weifangensis]|uniref:S9 family peptidase n=1 Tax=Cognatiluteimonas weifangensis TaxID=2303539 RepID=A0A372DIP9_9GAMM|nr:S9 family peptidase [Luteimonas weifangensis]RFP59460.1 S9 family peptidase [Luteimonas weifangensis]